MTKETKNIKLTLNFKDNDYWDVLSLCPIGPDAEEEIKKRNLSAEFSYDLFREPLIYGFEYEFIFMRPGVSPIFIIEEDGKEIDRFMMQNLGTEPDNLQKSNKLEEKAFQEYLEQPKADNYFWFEEMIKERMRQPKKDGCRSLIGMFKDTIRHSSTQKALLVYFKKATLGEISFDIEIPASSTFNPDTIKLFYWTGCSIKAVSPNFRKLLKKDLILLNAIRYEGKLYFSKDFLWMDERTVSFEFVDKRLKTTAI